MTIRGKGLLALGAAVGLLAGAAAWLARTPAKANVANVAAIAPSSAAKPWTIVTAFYPLYVTTLNIVGDAPGVRVVNLAPTSAGCTEGYQLSPADMVTLSGADALVVNGAGLEEYVTKVAAQFPQLKVITASDGLPLIGAGAEVNAHVWVSPTLAARETRGLAARLAALDPSPARAAVYAPQAEDYARRLEALAARFQTELADAPSRQVVAFHDGLPYLARDLRLQVLATVEPAPGQQPSAGDLANVVQQVRAAKGPIAFLTEKDTVNPAAEALGRELNMPLYPFDLATSGPLDPATARNAYLHIMENNLATLKTALQAPATAATKP